MIYILPTDTCYGIACSLDDKKSYEKIYKIKKRSFDKPLAVMVKNFDWLKKNTDLTDEQIHFLEQYDRPFTILTQSSPISLWINYQDDHEEHLINKDVYQEIGIRVAHNDVQEDLISTVGPIWLTSANSSGKWEIYTADEIESSFSYYIAENMIDILSYEDLDPEVPASDVFRFIGDSLKQEFIRKS